MKYNLLAAWLLTISPISGAVYAGNGEVVASPEIAGTQWAGRKVAFMGDSITDKTHVGTTKNYWQYLEEMLGLTALVYGVNGQQWSDIPTQCARLKAECGKQVDAIVIFAGTNDFNTGVPLGEWYRTEQVQVEVSGLRTESRERRRMSMDDATFRGRINTALLYLKTHFPTQQVILLTPIHRGYARFSDDNIQPDESYPNKIGLYVDAYVNAVKEAANAWAVPVIDLNSLCGLYPNVDAHVRYFHDGAMDRLHPGAEGHRRMAKALAYQLLFYPADFK